MSDLDAAIRAKLAADDARQADEIYWDVYRDAILAVLYLHADDEAGFGRECSDEFPAASPCPTLCAIAEKLGVEVPHG